MYSSPNFEPVHCSISSCNCCFLTSVQVSQEAIKVVWCSHLFKNVPQFVVIHTLKAFKYRLWSRSRWYFLEFCCFPYDPMEAGNLSSDSFAFSKSSLYFWMLSVYVLLKPSLKDFEHKLASMWNERNCMVFWIFFGTALLWDWNEKWPFPVLWPLQSIPNLLAF